MSGTLKKVAIIGGTRIPFCRSMTRYSNLGNREMMTGVLKELVIKYNLNGKTLGGVAVGAVVKSSRDFSLARECAIDAGISYETPAFDIQMACGTSLEAAIILGHKIAVGEIDSGIAGGVDSTSVVPIEMGTKLSAKLQSLAKAKTIGKKLKALTNLKIKDVTPKLPALKEPRTGLSMGDHCELMAKEWGITRADQDKLAFKSHQNTAKAYESGFLDDLVFPFHGVGKDNNVRPGTSLEKMGKLKPVFDREKGTLTAANSSPTTDGASACFLCTEEYALKHGLEIQSYLTFSQEAAVDYKNKEGLLMAPAYAVSRMLDRANLKLQDFDFYEIHEAFSAQVLCTLAAWNDAKFCEERLGRNEVLGTIDPSKLNVMGGSVAIGHPFAATGTRILAGLSKLLYQKGSGRGLISICTAGGMGVTAILERN
ncbi:MAG: acetyl-CoA C-acetyltransferase [Epsilonproteobacteria bacterium]|nr:MAG: acetyl-CoA C-acetyltransferase [Campylobacterota bacterium]RLA67755.1 MAG: acetyl-CoA C-acetyltransferase [Campylobacterota bacterium]